MRLDGEIKNALAGRAEAVALACMDTRSGLLLAMQVRGDVAPDDVEAAAFSAAQLCAAPDESLLAGDVEEECDESFVVSARWVHAFARVPSRRDIVVVGLAPGDANVALLRAWIREVAERVGPLSA